MKERIIPVCIDYGLGCHLVHINHYDISERVYLAHIAGVCGTVFGKVDLAAFSLSVFLCVLKLSVLYIEFHRDYGSRRITCGIQRIRGIIYGKSRHEGYDIQRRQIKLGDKFVVLVQYKLPVHIGVARRSAHHLYDRIFSDKGHITDRCIISYYPFRFFAVQTLYVSHFPCLRIYAGEHGTTVAYSEINNNCI